MTAETQPKRPRGRPRSQASENAILQATLDLLAEGGYSAVTVDKVASIACASKGTIYRRWPTKENLVIAAFELTTPLTKPGRGPVTEKLVEIIWQFTKVAQETPLGSVLPALTSERLHNPELDEALGPLMTARRQPIIEIINEAIEAGEFVAATDAEFVADLCMGPVQLRSVTLHLPVTRNYIRKVVETACASLLVRGEG